MERLKIFAQKTLNFFGLPLDPDHFYGFATERDETPFLTPLEEKAGKQTKTRENGPSKTGFFRG